MSQQTPGAWPVVATHCHAIPRNSVFDLFTHGRSSSGSAKDVRHAVRHPLDCLPPGRPVSPHKVVVDAETLAHASSGAFHAARQQILIRA